MGIVPYDFSRLNADILAEKILSFISPAESKLTALANGDQN